LSYWASALEHVPGSDSAAKARHEEALSVARQSRDPQALGMANMNMASWWARQRDYAQAKRYHLAALDWRRKGITRWTVGLSLRPRCSCSPTSRWCAGPGVATWDYSRASNTTAPWR